MAYCQRAIVALDLPTFIRSYRDLAEVERLSGRRPDSDTFAGARVPILPNQPRPETATSMPRESVSSMNANTAPTRRLGLLLRDGRLSSEALDKVALLHTSASLLSQAMAVRRQHATKPSSIPNRRCPRRVNRTLIPGAPLAAERSMSASREAGATEPSRQP